MSVFKYHAFIYFLRPPPWRTEHYPYYYPKLNSNLTSRRSSNSKTFLCIIWRHNEIFFCCQTRTIYTGYSKFFKRKMFRIYIGAITGCRRESVLHEEEWLGIVGNMRNDANLRASLRCVLPPYMRNENMHFVKHGIKLCLFTVPAFRNCTSSPNMQKCLKFEYLGKFKTKIRIILGRWLRAQICFKTSLNPNNITAVYPFKWSITAICQLLLSRCLLPIFCPWSIYVYLVN